MKVKQVIVWRNNLKVRTGKMMSQAAHASLGIFTKVIPENHKDYSDETHEAIDYWLNNEFTKVVLQVNSEAELLDLYNKARYLNIPTILITDNGKTEFNGVKTNTCIAIGPDLSDNIDKLTKDLKLM